MDFQHAERSRGLLERVSQFARRHVEPVEELYYELVEARSTAARRLLSYKN